MAPVELAPLANGTLGRLRRFGVGAGRRHGPPTAPTTKTDSYRHLRCTAVEVPGAIDRAAVLLVWASYVFVIAYLARWKGRSVLGWLILDHLLPLVGLILLVFRSPKPGSKAAAQAESRSDRDAF